MAFNTQWDGYQVKDLGLPYDRSQRELSDDPRITSGFDMYVTTGGRLAKRPGTSLAFNAGGNFTQVDRIWLLESLDSTPALYLVASVYNVSGSLKWSLWTKPLTSSLGSSSWTSAGSYRDINASVRPHEAVNARGKLYVKGFPSAISAEKLGTVVLEDSSGSIVVRPWGLGGPTIPARIQGSVTKVTAVAAAGDVTLNVTSTASFPAAPFVIQVNYEQMNVTAKAATSFTVTRGYNNTTAEAHSVGSPVLYRSWSSSDHIVTVNQFWRYAYAFKTVTGQISNRSPEETNPDLLPSRTGPFFDQCPVISFTGHSDTTYVPTIVIYRSTDGGGSFYKLSEVTNPGAIPGSFTDNLLASGAGGATFNDPTPDSVLDQADVAPSLTSNSPPPTVLSPLVTGVDTPDQSATKLAYFQGRIWFAIGNTVFFSGNEEVTSGVPEECFPSGLTGNFFRYQNRVANIENTTKSLYVGTTSNLNEITGSNKETFDSQPIYEQYGMHPSFRRSTTRFGENIAFLTYDYRVMILSPQGIKTISDPILTDIIDQIPLGVDIELKYFTDTDKEWLIMAAHRNSAASDSKIFVYDLKRSLKENRDFWFTPWRMASCALYTNRLYTDISRRELIIVHFNALNGYFTRLDNTGLVGTDYQAGSSVGFACYAHLNLSANPAGNHVNTLRNPGLTSVLERIVVEYVSSATPTVGYGLDDSTTSVIMVTGVAPARRTQSTGYTTKEYHVYKACQRARAYVANTSPFTATMEVQNIAYIWQPESGA